MKYLVLLLTIISFSAHATCTKPVTTLKEGEQAPCYGYLFTPEKELEVRLKVSTYDQMEELTKKQDELNKILSDRIVVQQELNLKLNDKLQQQENTNFWMNFAYFSLGAFVTALVAKSVK